MKVANKVGSGRRGGTDGATVLNGRYHLGSRLGEGADSEVFAAHDAQQGNDCALKLYRKNVVASGRASDEFLHLTRLRHRHIVSIRDVGQVRGGPFAGRLFLVTDRVPGLPFDSLATIVDQGERSRRFCASACALADALAYLHSRGLIHGDITPANIRFDADQLPILLDFGLAQPHAAGRAGTATAVFGTLGYLAPEALVGERGPQSDLFALGATLFAAWTGAAPFGVGLESIRKLRQGSCPRLSSVRPGLSDFWDDVLAGLLAPAPEQRYPGARAVLRDVLQKTGTAAAAVDLDLNAPIHSGDPLAGVFIGRKGEQARLATVLTQLAAGHSPVSVVTVEGPPGSGRRTLIQRVLREFRLALMLGTLPDFEIDDSGVVRAPTIPGATTDDAAAAWTVRMGRVADAWETRSASRPLCLLLPPGDDAEALAKIVAATEPTGRLLLLLPVTTSPVPHARSSVLNIALPPFDRNDIAALIEAAGHDQGTSPRVVEDLAQACGGNAAVAAIVVRRWLMQGFRAGGEGDAIPAVDDSAAAGLLDVGFAALEPHIRRVLIACALLPTAEAPLVVNGVDGLDPATSLRAAEAFGWLRRRDDLSPTIPSDLHRAAIMRALDAPDVADLVRRATCELPPTDARLGDAWAALGQTDRAVAAFGAAAQAALKNGLMGAGWQNLGRAHALCPGALGHAQRLELATGLGILGRFEDALRALEGPVGPPPDLADAEADAVADEVAIVETRAWLLGRQGQAAAACEALQTGIDKFDSSTAAATSLQTGRLRLLARLARAFVAAGRLSEALAASQAVMAAPGPAGIVAHEAAILARAYRGEIGAADALVGQLKQRLSTCQVDDPALRARSYYLAGLCDQMGGRTGAAVAAYGEALKLYRTGVDPHACAAAALNLGCVLADQGRYGAALPQFQRAIRELGRLQAAGDLVSALFNLALLFIRLGDPAAATRAARRVREEADGRGVVVYQAFADCIEADVQRWQRAPQNALPGYARAAHTFRTAGHTVMAIAADVAHAEALAECGRWDDACAHLLAIDSRDTSASGGQMDEAILLARGRVALGRPVPETAPDGEIATDLMTLGARAHSAGRAPTAWRSYLLSARLTRRLHDNADGSWKAPLATARSIFEEVKMLTPPPYRPGLDADPDARFFANGAEASSPSRQSDLIHRADRAESRLRRLLRINKRLNSELRPSRVLETIIDTVIELTNAERGFVLLKNELGVLEIKIARNIDQATLEGPELALSRSIAARVADGGEPIVTIDASGDERFRASLSVSNLRLRSVLAVPLVVKGKPVGAIYVDHRLRKDVFGDDDLELISDFADQGAIAVENARLLAELRRRERQVEALNRRLEADLAARSEEISEIRQEIKESHKALAVRYDYHQIVGRSPRMLELFALLDRVTDTSLPAVIQGESGTGKELVARAIHFNGARRDKPFVSENCAAIPETLLESTLFGYVKGAFTGAERDARGLFAVADGGTLFLDEVGEMSPAMQGKLLRVLQEGELRRVGSDRSQKVDVRIVVATNKNLARLVEEKKFRQDLFYRLSVVRIDLPALRERSEDIPLLVQHFLQVAAGPRGQPKAIDSAAMRKLVNHRWPGNVRELENEIARAAAFSQAAITTGDLSPGIAASIADGVSPAEDHDSLALRPRVERLERTLIREALLASSGNQTKAAAALGLSRFGLQKKLQRYRMGASA